MPDRKYKTRHRIEGRGHARLINVTCFHNRPFLQSERSCTWVIEAIERAREKHGFRLWAYCIMPNHVHLLILPSSTVPPILRSVKQSVANRAIAWLRSNAPAYLHTMNVPQKDGSVACRFWQRGGGYDRNLWNAKHFWEAIDDIHMNPVEAGLCARPEDWVWSSARFFTRERAGPIEIDMASVPSQPA